MHARPPTSRLTVRQCLAALLCALCLLAPVAAMAGRIKEVAGIEHAEATLYDGRLAILTPLESSGAPQLAAARALWPALGSRVRELSPEAHDDAFAAVSHLPHLLAFAYVNGIAAQPRGADYLSLAGPGFRDFTRIAASDPAVWHDILLANRADVLAQTRAFRQALDQLERAIVQDDGAALRGLIAQASQTRSGWKLNGVDQDQ
jgi:prephenate dehydrogenase